MATTTIEIEWVTIQTAAAHYKCSVKTVRRWITANLIEAKRFGPRLIRVNMASVENMGRRLQYVGN
jgi:excisionase family DNA binding protein